MNCADGDTDLLGRVLRGEASSYALLHRPESTGPGRMEVLVGSTSSVEQLADLPLSDHAVGTAGHEVLVLVPYRQLAERGFDVTDDGEPLLAMTVTAQAELPVTGVLSRIPDTGVRLDKGAFDVEDDAYADIVERVIRDEIGTGAGANFVIRRSFVAEIPGYTPLSALTFFTRLMARETGAYWTFVIHTGDRTFVGATPERHVSLSGGTAVMNPISGTYRYPATGPTLTGLLDFLDDRKETEELYMVVDEELKMMARICHDGCAARGPYLKEMARLAHTEYFIEGRSRRDPREILRETMFAPTVTGSPLESAASVIARYEPEGRGYYSGVAALIGRDTDGRSEMDSSILIRTADIDVHGRARIGVGATLVRHSDPFSEVAETAAKSAGLLDALRTGSRRTFSDHPQVLAALADRNTGIARFWLPRDAERPGPREELLGRRVLVVDAEDTFTAMIGHQLDHLGLDVQIRRYDEPYSLNGHDLVVLGPGPGDPCEADAAKIAHLRRSVRTLLADRRPFLAVCLSHQVLCGVLGLPIVRRDQPNQGLQKEIDFFGRHSVVGFYNAFAAHSAEDELDHPDIGVVQVSRSPRSGEVHGLLAPHFASMQFHAESVLTQNGEQLLGDLITRILQQTDRADRLLEVSGPGATG